MVDDDFMPLSTAFQSYQYYEGFNIRLLAMESRLRLARYPPRAGLEPGTASSVGQRLTYCATRAPTIY